MTENPQRSSRTPIVAAWFGMLLVIVLLLFVFGAF